MNSPALLLAKFCVSQTSYPWFTLTGMLWEEVEHECTTACFCNVQTAHLLDHVEVQLALHLQEIGGLERIRSQFFPLVHFRSCLHLKHNLSTFGHAHSTCISISSSIPKRTTKTTRVYASIGPSVYTFPLPVVIPICNQGFNVYVSRSSPEVLLNPISRYDDPSVRRERSCSTTTARRHRG